MINYLNYTVHCISTVEEIDRRCSCGPLSGRRNFDRRSDGARVRASVESTVKRPKRIHSNEMYVQRTLFSHLCAYCILIVINSDHTILFLAYDMSLVL